MRSKLPAVAGGVTAAIRVGAVTVTGVDATALMSVAVAAAVVPKVPATFCVLSESLLLFVLFTDFVDIVKSFKNIIYLFENHRKTRRSG